MANQDTSSTEAPAVYFKHLILTNVKCFKELHGIYLLNEYAIPATWTVLLGNNGTGKTTILRCLASLEPVKEFNGRSEKSVDTYYYPKDIDFSFSNTDDWSIYAELQHLNDSLSWERIQSGDTVYSTDTVNFDNFIIYGYGINRKMSNAALSESQNPDTTASLFSNDIELLNVEEWLLQTDYAIKNGAKEATKRLEKIKQVLTNGILPDVQDFRFTTDEKLLKTFVEFKTDYGWVRLRDLGYGYQACITWLGDLVKRMFDRYPDAENPLAMPAIVLVDEIDMHLHPSWQRKIIGFLSRLFPYTQFIVTAHSPLIVQSAENVNVVLLEKEGDHVTIRQPKFGTYKGWSVEEILTELMGMEDKTYSEAYLELIQAFEAALDEEDYAKAKHAYDELDKILHPESAQRKLLRIQMSSLSPTT